jgi:hypothetical protein
MKKYFPILLSKAGELTALRHLTQNVRDEVSPIIEVLPSNLSAVETHILPHWNFPGNQVLLDFSLFDPFDRNAVRAFFQHLFTHGINAVPVIQQNSDPRYIALVQTLVANNNWNVCVRASNGSGGFANYNNVITTLQGQVGITRPNTLLLIDLGYVEQNNYNIFGTVAINTIQNIPNRNQYSELIVAAGSFPEDLTKLLPVGRLHRLQRFEWDIWQSIIANANLANSVKYSDYGTKNPFYREVNFRGSCSIRYTTQNDFAIYRGELSQNHAQGNGQYIIFADRLTHSADYSGVGFSWGDDQIENIGTQILTNPGRRTGNATTWVEISQNHHVTILHSLL